MSGWNTLPRDIIRAVWCRPNIASSHDLLAASSGARKRCPPANGGGSEKCSGDSLVNDTVKSHNFEHIRQISLATRGDPVWPRVPGRGRGLSQSVCREQDAIHLAARRVVDLRRRVCDSHWARTFSI